MRNKEIKISRPLYATAKLTLGNYVKQLFNTQYVGSELINKQTGSYIILGNHTNFWDPVLVAYGVSEHIYFVSSDEYFRKGILKFLLPYAGAIPKTKFFSDSETVKNIIKVRKKGGIIGIFPEGKRNWDGTTLEILYPTAKLIKSLKIPVIVTLLKGAALSYPRWAKKSRKGKLIVEYKMALDPDQIENLSVDEIYQVITTELTYDEYDWQKEQMIPFKGKLLAEQMELFLFTCPHCKTIGSMRSTNDHFYCQECGYSTSYNLYGYLTKESDILYFDNPRDWNYWQLEYLNNLSEELDDSTPLISDEKVSIFKGRRLSPLTRQSTGQITLYSKVLEFTSRQGEHLSFVLEKIQGMNIQYNNQFEFYYNKSLYRFSFELSHISAYKWSQAIMALQNRSKN